VSDDSIGVGHSDTRSFGFVIAVSVRSGHSPDRGSGNQTDGSLAIRETDSELRKAATMPGDGKYHDIADYNEPYQHAEGFLDDATEHPEEAAELIQRALVCAVLAAARELSAIEDALTQLRGPLPASSERRG
jgi:hypothetical protein